MGDMKFRAWDKDNKCWCDDFCIELSTGRLLCDHGRTIYVQEIVLMQFTGLKDKNGKEIYEGDIVDCKDNWWRGIVSWQSSGSIGWCIEPLAENKCRGRYGLNDNYVFEVIGNIHDNPTLLEGK